jgi:hypothetical protein
MAVWNPISVKDWFFHFCWILNNKNYWKLNNSITKPLGHICIHPGYSNGTKSAPPISLNFLFLIFIEWKYAKLNNSYIGYVNHIVKL